MTTTFDDVFPTKEGLIALHTLQYHVHGNDVDESTLGYHTLKLRRRYRSKGVKNFSVTLSPSFKGSSEELAEALNYQDGWFDDPINNLVSRIESHIFCKKDYVSRIERAVQCIKEEPFIVPVEMSIEQRQKVSNYKKDIELFSAAIDMIKDLGARLDGRK